MTVKVVIQGIPEIVKKLEPGTLYGRALKEVMDETRKYGYQTMTQKRAPVGETGDLVAAVDSRLDTREVPLFASVEIPHLPTKEGFRYGGALEGGSKYRYRSGPLRGKPTKGWWSGTKKLMQSYLRRVLPKALRRIEQDWNR